MEVMTLDVLYDGDCGLCSATVRWLRRVDLAGRLRFVDINAEWDRLVGRHPHLDAAACASAMHVIGPGGRITVGFDGFRTIARALVLLWPVVPILYLPGVPPVGRRVYAYVAAHRPTTCTLPRATTRT